MKLIGKPNQVIIDKSLKLLIKFDAKGEKTTVDSKLIAKLSAALDKQRGVK